ncbi:hypothetical protein IQ269_09040 [Tychonema sp. LEGE 07199]|nr:MULTISPECIES: hypothetical protein [unclassified Tychonema]MBE9120959.1 hypothetical protein [Tychonema sp. LEGE 07199]MBE9135343.1 hypothetical protein [Tychonema sp. LEGE 07196]
MPIDVNNHVKCSAGLVFDPIVPIALAAPEEGGRGDRSQPLLPFLSPISP